MTRETFCSLLKVCRELHEYIQRLYSVEITLIDSNILYRTIDSIIFALDDEFDSENVSYYFFERDCNGMEMGGKPTPFLWEADDTPIWIHSDEELYDYLLANKKED